MENKESKLKYKMKHRKELKKEWRASRGPGRKVLAVVGMLVQAVLVAFLMLILFLTVSEYKPESEETVAITGRADYELSKGDSFTVMTWNTGYGALGDNADFFMDGGTSVETADRARVDSNMEGMISEIKKVDPDVLMVQETDRASDRSHQLNEYELIQSKMTEYNSSFANNFKVAFLPYPVPPIGKVDSGIATFSKYQFDNAKRVQLPIPFKWPVRMANLKRCLLISRTPIKGTDKDLVIVNLHLEAYDSGEGKIAQTKRLANIINEEYRRGNYVIVGGDFNQIFDTEDPDKYPLQEGMWHPGVIAAADLKGVWSLLMDESVPTCRSLDRPYAGADHSNFQYYLIDGFIVSGNIDVESYATQDLDFVCSDHNPVLMKVKLR